MLLTLFLMLSNAQAAQDVLYACKKQDVFVPSSYTWVEIDRNTVTNQLTFLYGIGSDTQMIEIDFSSPVVCIEGGRFVSRDQPYDLSVVADHRELSFLLKDSKNSVSGKHFQCQP